jgi:hypothetical protein
VEEPVVVESTICKIPKIIFIVPYRNREQHLIFFKKHMSEILSDYLDEDYKLFIIHQQDTREFNRGALKNIGFLVVKEKYPNDYKNITLVFNDVDTMPLTKNFLNYETHTGNIKHFYGYTFSLGGIVSIKGSDFERINGYPNLWTWGFEDNMLQNRVLNDPTLKIDRSQFYPILDQNILQLKDGIERLVNRSEFDRYLGNTSEGINSIHHLNYKESNEMINIFTFETGNAIDPSQSKTHNLKTGNVPFKKMVRKNKMGMIFK